MTYHDLQRKLHENPFKSFRIKLANNTTYDINEPWMVTIGESSAVVVTHTRTDDRGYNVALDWRTVSISHMLEFTDIEPKRSAQKRKSA